MPRERKRFLRQSVADAICAIAAVEALCGLFLAGMTCTPLSLSQTSSGWQLIENQATLLWDEGSLQTYWLDGRRSAPVAGNA